MRRRRSGKRRSRRSYFRRRRGISSYGTKGSLWGLAAKVLPTVGFLEQLTQKSRAQGKYAGTMMQNAQTLVNNITGNIFGFNPLPGGQKFTAQRNLAGINNTYTGIGIASLVGSLVLRKSGITVPGLSKIFTIGKRMLVPGIVGGYFDDAPTNYTAPRMSVSTPLITPQSNWSSLGN